MSGLFCADPKFMYRTQDNKFMLEVYEDGTVSLLNFRNKTATTFKSMEVIEVLCNMLFEAVIDNDIREYKKQLALAKQQVEIQGVQECPRCNIYNSFDDAPDDPVNDLFRCNNCNDLVHISSIILIHHDDLDDIPF